jgi:lipopolysaccharide/colanic/teichoic acid biosynthesis glycosyltransferase
MTTGGTGPYRLKRAFDVIAASTGLLITSPVMVVIALLVRLTSPGPAVYRTVRVGQYGQNFTLYKFRSMRSDSDGHRITASGDTRITPIGRILRKAKLDELPQLVNVIRGDMSIVGPRPEDPKYVDVYDDHQRSILAFRPGITSPASIRYRHEEALLDGAADLEEAYRTVAAAKIELDLAYFSCSSLAGDLRLIFQTVAAILRRPG